ncbi:unnamed protein product [Urochloa decumbens]|uniref:DUF1618 domain-containing protein n=1 Tax=Urochloa decumbens TaxID=240449 RepID=A0ABC9DWH2_9POAL
MKISGLHSNSLRPPALSAADDAAATCEEKLPYILLELEAYVADRVNATTASCTTCDGKRVQVTLCPRRPPRVSYVCVHSPDAAEINMEPDVLTTDGDLVLLRLTVGAIGRRIDDNTDYYIYRAGAGGGAEGPSLILLPRPSTGDFFNSWNIGILRYCPGGAGADDEAYVLAGLNERRRWRRPDGELDLSLYDSEQGLWKTVEASLKNKELRQLQHGGEDFCHENSKVIAVGGDAGTVAFVDLWRGIIFCDVLPVLKDDDVTPTLRYVKLPRPLRRRNRDRERGSDPRLYRDIAVVGDRIRYVEMQAHYTESTFFCNKFVTDGWMAITWSMPACVDSSPPEGWQLHSKVMNSRTLKVDQGNTSAPFVTDYFCQPVLSLGDGVDVVYFTTKWSRIDADGWVVSVDLEKKELLDEASFVSQRNVGINLAYIHSRISSYL